MRRIIFLSVITVLLSCNCLNGMSESPVVQIPDSLLMQLSASGIDNSQKMSVLNDIVNYCFDNNENDTVLSYINQYKELAQEENDKQYYLQAEINLAKYNIRHNNFGNSIESLLKTKTILNEMNNIDNKNVMMFELFNLLHICYSHYEMLPVAYDYCIKGKELVEKSFSSDTAKYIKCLSNLGAIYYEMDSLYKTNNILSEILSYDNISAGNKFRAYRNIAAVYQKLHLYDLGLTYCDSAFPYCQNGDDKANLMSLIGCLYDNKGDHSEAKKYYSTALSIYDTIDVVPEKYFGMINLSKVYCSLGICDSAIILVNKGIEGAKKMNLLWYECDGELSKSRILERLGMFEESLYSLKKYNILKDSLEAKRNLDHIRVVIQQQSMKSLEDKMKYQLAEQKLLAEVRRTRQIIIIVIAVSVLFVATVIFIYYVKRKNIRLKNEQHSKQLLAEELDIQKRELDLRNRELTSNLLNQVQESELLKDVIEKLTVIENNPDNPESNIHTLIYSLKRSLNNNTHKDFEYYFLQVHPEFYKKLLKDFPSLTGYEQRLCAFLKLNLPTKDIATIMGINIDSVKTARKRLRKKLNLTDADDSIASFLSKY